MRCQRLSVCSSVILHLCSEFDFRGSGFEVYLNLNLIAFRIEFMTVLIFFPQ